MGQNPGNNASLSFVFFRVQIFISDILFGYIFLRFGYKKSKDCTSDKDYSKSHVAAICCSITFPTKEKDNLQVTPGPPSVLVSKTLLNVRGHAQAHMMPWWHS